MELRPPPSPPSRIIGSYGVETTESVINRKLWEDDMERWKKEFQKFQAMKNIKPKM